MINRLIIVIIKFFIKANEIFHKISSQVNNDNLLSSSPSQKEIHSSEKIIATPKSLKLRYFTEYEISSIMGFPKEFSFPPNITLKQRYKVLGNSINVKVVAELIKYLLLDDQ